MKKSIMKEQWSTSHLSGGSMAYIDALYEDYLASKDTVSEEWRTYFDSLANVNGELKEESHKAIREQFENLARFKSSNGHTVSTDLLSQQKQAQVIQLINAYRLHGHHQANLDPLGIAKRRQVPELEMGHYHLKKDDLNTKFHTPPSLFKTPTSLKEIIDALDATYCQTVAVEYMHITDTEEVRWLEERLEGRHGHYKCTQQNKKSILMQLTAAEGLERYLGTKYVGQKRFSLEGGDTLIPMLRCLVDEAGQQAVQELVIGMPHRGRLNVLVNVLGKSPEDLFQEFEGKQESTLSGDVKYHKGYSSDVETEFGGIHLSLSFNPSHLEIISPVIMGSVRSRQRRHDDLLEKRKIVPIVMHGDAAFAGQGVVMETFNFSQARGYNVGGCIHIVVNNQIGFTTSNPLDARSTLYCTDVAKMVQAPIFHVNGDDPEACLFITKMALDYRMRFKKDVVIDLVCYRRHGHNEADEPSVTQPRMYQYVKSRQTTRELYAEKLIKEGLISKQEADGLTYDYRDALDNGSPIVKTMSTPPKGRIMVNWSQFLEAKWDDEVDTTINKESIQTLNNKLHTQPDGFTIHPVVKRLFNERNKMAQGEIEMNWGFAEIMAYASLVTEDSGVRLSGQDSGRGTFAHRHAVLHDFKTGEEYVPLEHLSQNQKPFLVIDSVLSEEAVLAFEYGFSAAEPNTLVLWEAQFGDFVNGAQVVIDQFISSGEQKWGRLCGLVMLLPHGFEGQGPEHSSARLERFMQLCAQHNMQVAAPTTPAQIFHLLRRQMIRKFRKPLIIMTPKSLLRHKLATSPLSDLTDGQFHTVIPELDDLDKDKVKRLIFCSGKVYYDLLKKRRENKQTEMAIIRLEQLYPFPVHAMTKIVSEYKNATDVVWCQEEPMNQGVWFSSQHHMKSVINTSQTLRYVGREFFAAPAVGYPAIHLKQQHALVDKALADLK